MPSIDPRVNPWHPMSNARDVKHLGKLGEELNECGAAVMRCLIQGIEEPHPVTGKVNREWLEDEIADVEANIALVKCRFNLDGRRITQRAEDKAAQLMLWHDMA